MVRGLASEGRKRTGRERLERGGGGGSKQQWLLLERGEK